MRKAKEKRPPNLTITIVHPEKKTGVTVISDQSEPAKLEKPYAPAAIMSMDMSVTTPGLPPPSDPDCAAYGHDTRVGCWGITCLALCAPCTLIW